MRILVTNDDGINAPGLRVAEAIAAQIASEAGPDAEVWTVAPAFEQSGVAHCISYTRPMMVAKLGERRFAAEGSPADCVITGVHDVLPEPPDLVISGVNRGNNSGENALYSGTLGGAMEGALQGCRAIALSQYYGPGNRELEDTFEASAAHGADVVRALLADECWDTRDGYLTFYNVNFPPVAAADVKGRQVVQQGQRPGQVFSVTPHHSPSGRRFVWISGGRQDVAAPEDTDISANLAGYISVTPMRADLTDHQLLATLRDTLE